MKHRSTRLSYESTGYFSKIVTDYIQQSESIRPFYLHVPDIDGIRKAIKARNDFATPRKVLVDGLMEQYQQVTVTDAVKENIQSLLSNDTYTVVTAHQPNIFTGPLYFIYKIIHTIQLAGQLSQDMPGKKFVPVYYMGSEDADLEELGHLYVDGHPLSWKTSQTGAVGRMKVDKELMQILHAIEGQTGVLPFGNQLSSIFREAYVEGRTVQEATLHLVNRLFGRLGLVVLIPDRPSFKSCFASVIQKELQEGFSHTVVTDTIAALAKSYKVQAAGRAINLFYLLDNRRERIEKSGDVFTVPALELTFTGEEILQELSAYPERFSPNVILRGAFQETILPNVAFIGGGGELAYWLELKEVFQAIRVPYPVLVLRNSFLLMSPAQELRMQQLGFDIVSLFRKADVLLNVLVVNKSTQQLSLKHEWQALKDVYQQIESVAGGIDVTLLPHITALKVKAEKQIVALEKKMLRAEKRKFEAEQRQIITLKQQLFPDDSLQERVDNFSHWFARYGENWIDLLKTHSPSLKPEFSVIVIE